MRPHATLLTLVSIAGLWLGAGAALAQEAPADAPGDRRARREAFCRDNPEKCEQMKQKRAERREFCKQNPEKCEEQRAKLKQRREELKARCAEDPAKCEEMKQEARERWKSRRDAEPAPAP